MMRATAPEEAEPVGWRLLCDASKQTKPPTVKYKKKKHLIYEQRAFVINQAKWSAAREYCKKIGGSFIILTEKELISNK